MIEGLVLLGSVKQHIMTTYLFKLFKNNSYKNLISGINNQYRVFVKYNSMDFKF